MTYAELLAEIKLLSRRADIDDKIAIALRMTTLRAHRSDYFWRDLVEVNAAFGLANIVTVDTSTALTRFRQISYVQYLELSTGNVGSMLDETDPATVLDEYNYFKTDCWYMAGNNLQINFAYQTTGARIGYWQNPNVTTGGYNSWIKDDLPDLLVQGSLAYIYNMTGKQEEAKAINRMCGFEPDPANRAPGMTLLDQLRGSNLRGSGHA